MAVMVQLDGTMSAEVAHFLREGHSTLGRRLRVREDRAHAERGRPEAADLAAPRPLEVGAQDLLHDLDLPAHLGLVWAVGAGEDRSLKEKAPRLVGRGAQKKEGSR